MPYGVAGFRKGKEMKKIILIITVIVLSPCWSQGQDLKRLMNLRGYWKFSIGDHLEWASVDYDDSDWEEIYVPNRWEREGFNGYDGYAWYRNTFKGKELEGETKVYLKLGYIDDVDEVYFNGEKIGFTGSFPPDYNTAWKAERLYRIPERLLKQNGDNLIAVRIFDQGGEGGIYSGDVGLLVADDDFKESIYLEGQWKIRVSDREEYADPDYDDSHWENIMVPSNWKTIGIHDLDDFAWYRKEFEVYSEESIEDMTLIGGYIDDFDEIFINGKKIGATKDGRRLGWSRSFSELRIYNIPDGLLKVGKNTIAVRVEDIGDNGGIYKGPVMIVPSREVTRISRRSLWWR